MIFTFVGWFAIALAVVGVLIVVRKFREHGLGLIEERWLQITSALTLVAFLVGAQCVVHGNDLRKICVLEAITGNCDSPQWKPWPWEKDPQ